MLSVAFGSRAGATASAGRLVCLLARWVVASLARSFACLSVCLFVVAMFVCSIDLSFLPFFLPAFLRTSVCLVGGFVLFMHANT